MGYRLKKLVIHNFKLFSHIEINIDENNLVMLDGPNGYGKTSIFDALEYLFTGDVKRISENKVCKTNISFEEDCLIKNPSDGTQTYVTGVFDEAEKFKIIRKLSEGKGAENNPSKIKSRTKTTLVWNEETVCDDANVDEANKEISLRLGKGILDHYLQFYYVSQEGRLQFLSKSEENRNSELQKLFGIDKEEENYQKVKDTLKVFQNLKKKYSGEFETKKQEVKNIEKEMEGIDKESQVTYKDLIADNELKYPLWNQEHPRIENKDKLLEMAERVRAAGYFSREIGLYRKDKKNNWIEDKIKDKETLKKFLYLNGHSEELDSLKTELEQYHEILKILEAAEREAGGGDYEKYNYKRLKEILNLQVDLEEVTRIKNEIKDCRKNVKAEDTARDKITRLQEQLKKEWEAWQDSEYKGLPDNQCPLCGHPYKNKDVLMQTLDTCRAALESGKEDSQKQVDQNINSLKEVYDLHCKIPIEEYLAKYKYHGSDICKELYKDWDKISRGYRSFIEESEEYGISNKYTITEEDFDKADEIAEEFVVWLKGLKSVLSDEYYDHKEKYQYDNILSLDYQNSREKVKVITEEEVEAKIRYVEQEYYGGRQKELEVKKEEQRTLEERVKKLAAVEEHLKKLRANVKKYIDDYKSELVNQLKIPFYLYSGRILQNYPGGLGIWMQEVKGGKIRFATERRKEHDVLYTLSSGQLSAVAIAIALTLNKTYAQQNLKCMFIDDPIQTMDELNIASFVEVLRTDFTEYQFILSTHEDDFSDYIRYKFDRYGLSNCSVEVQTLDKGTIEKSIL